MWQQSFPTILKWQLSIWPGSHNSLPQWLGLSCVSKMILQKWYVWLPRLIHKSHLVSDFLLCHSIWEKPVDSGNSPRSEELRPLTESQYQLPVTWLSCLGSTSPHPSQAFRWMVLQLTSWLYRYERFQASIIQLSYS